MLPVEILKDIYWVGAIDWNIRDFHGYSVDRGTTYNAFLLMDDKITLFDTVKKGFKGDLLENIRKIIDPTKIDYVVVNHVEMDHSSLVPEIVELVQPEKLFCSEMGKKNLLSHFHTENWPYEVVKTGDTSAWEKGQFSLSKPGCSTGQTACFRMFPVIGFSSRVMPLDSIWLPPNDLMMKLIFLCF